MKNRLHNFIEIALIVVILILAFLYSQQTHFRTSYSIWEKGDKFFALGTFIINDNRYKNDSNKIQLAHIECDLTKKSCVESMVLNNHNIILANYIEYFSITETDSSGFRAKTDHNATELIYNRTLNILTKNYQIDGSVYPLKLEYIMD